jgi:hypothetical protein
MNQKIEQKKTSEVEPHNPLDVSGHFAVAEYLARQFIDSMTPQERIKFLLLFPEVSIVPSGKEITVKQNHPSFANQTTALEFHLMDDGKIVRAVLPYATFKLVHERNDRYDLDEKGEIRMNTTYKPYAHKLGGVLATREVNFALAKALIDKEKKGMLNPVDEEMLKIYRDLMVADKRGLLKIDGAKIVHEYYLDGRDNRGAALYVLPLEQPIDADLEKVPEPSEILSSVENPTNGRSKNEDSSTSIASPLESERQNYDDARPGVAPHPAINFSVAVNSDVVASAHLRELLGEDATVLMSDWGDRIDFTKYAPTSNKVTLLIDSNNKDRTTQDEDFKASGLEFADDLQATIVCATLVKKAKDAGLDLREVASSWKENQSEAISQLNEAELDLLTKLRDGVVRSRSGALAVDSDGRLRVFNDYDGGYRNRLAFGASPSAE